MVTQDAKTREREKALFFEQKKKPEQHFPQKKAQQNHQNASSC